MLDRAIAGGGCLRNFGLHAFDMFLHILGEDAEVVAAQISSQALGRPVEDYACVQLRSKSGVLGVIEVGNTFPFDGRPNSEPGLLAGDSELVLSGRDAMLMATKDGLLRKITVQNQETMSAKPESVPAFAILCDTLERWKAGKPPVTDARDCWRAMKLADDAYRLATRPR